MTTKTKKPANQKSKSVYFNIDDPSELRIYEYVSNIKNVSGYLKAILYADMMRNNGQAPAPYDYATIMHTNVLPLTTPVTVQRPTSVMLAESEVAASTVEPLNPAFSLIIEEDEGEDDPILDDNKVISEDEVVTNVKEVDENEKTGEGDSSDDNKSTDDKPRPKPQRNVASFLV